MSVGIYKIENNINHKIYIGQSIDIEKRWLHHKFLGQNLKDYDTSYYIHAALNKYGVENFEFSIIETCKPDELNDKEYIGFLNIIPVQIILIAGDTI